MTAALLIVLNAPGDWVLPGVRLPLAELWATVAAEYAEDGEGGDA